MVEELITMCKSAGLAVAREPEGLLRDNGQDRPADLFIWDWPVQGIQQTKHTIDFTAPLADSKFAKLNLADSELRASTVGVVARAAEQRKRDYFGYEEEQRTRGNAATMQERCRREGINFWPIVVE